MGQSIDRRASCVAAVLGLLLLAPLGARGELAFTGVNLAGADFGEGNLPGTFNQHYTYPNSEEVDYYVDKGVNVFRLPFRWERLQLSLGGELDATELGRMDAVVDYATGLGATVVLDPHNYARYRTGGSELLIGSAALPNSTLADFWGRLSDHYKDNDNVVFGLMNEPNSMPTEQWASAANDAIAAIRGTGAENLVLVPGNAWTGAHSWNQNWYGTPNAQVMLGITDPADNFAFDVHQYLDNDSSGTTDTIVSETIGQQRLVEFTDWLHTNDRRGFLGEFGAANATIGDGGGQIGDEAIDNLLDYMEAHDDVWLGWTWWAGGPWWGDYRFTIEPTDLGQPSEADRPSMDLLEPRFVGIAGPPSADFNNDGTVDAADYTVWRDGLGSTHDAADYDLWFAQYGQTTGQAVPEPGSAVLALAAFAAAAPSHRRMGSK